MDKNKGLIEIASGSLWVLLGTIMGYILEYANKIIIARFFGPSGYGVISLALTFSMIAISFSLLGLHTGAARFIAVYMAKNEVSKVKSVITQGLKIIVPTSLFFSICFFFGKEFIISHFIKKPDVEKVIITFILSIPIAVTAEYFFSCLRGLKLAKYAIFSKEVVRRLITLIILLIVIFVGKNLFFVALAYLIGFVGYMFITALFTNKGIAYSKHVVHNNLDVIQIRELLSFSLPLVFSFILMQFGAQMSNIFLGYYRTPREVGLFSAALPFSRLIGFPLTVVLFMFLPVMSEYWRRKQIIEMEKIFKTICRWLFVISGLVFVIFVFYAKLIIVHSFGKNFYPAYKALIILSIGQFFNTICGPTGAILLAAGESKKYFLGDTFSITFALILYLFFVPKFGFIGAAYVNMGQMLLVNLIRLFFVYKITKICPFDGNLLSIIIVLNLLMLFLKKIHINLNFQFFGIILIYFFVIIITKILRKEDLVLFYNFLHKKLSGVLSYGK